MNKPAVNKMRMPAQSVQSKPETDQRAQLSEAREKLHQIFGQLVLAVSSLPQYQSRPLSDLKQLILEPLLQNKLVIAKSSGQQDWKHDDGLLGAVIWASVSEAVDANIRKQISENTYPVLLKGEDWQSGEIHWLLDVIAPNYQTAEKLVHNAGTLIGKHAINIHPNVQRIVFVQRSNSNKAAGNGAAN